MKSIVSVKNLVSLNSCFCCIIAEPEISTQEVIPPEHTVTHSEEKDIKHVIIPITDSDQGMYPSDSEHYPVIIKTEDDRIPGSDVPLEEKISFEPKAVEDDHLPAQQEHQSQNMLETEEEALEQQSIPERDLEGNNQDQENSHSLVEITNKSLLEPEIIHEQIQGDQMQEEEEMPIEQIQEETANVPVPDQNQIASENAALSRGFVQESAQGNAQEQHAELYTPEEQNIPQSHPNTDGLQQESYEDNTFMTSDSHEPWVMVDYPLAEEHDSIVNHDDKEPPQTQQEMEHNSFEPETAEEENDYQDYVDDQRIDTEDIEDEQPEQRTEVCIAFLHQRKHS